MFGHVHQRFCAVLALCFAFSAPVFAATVTVLPDAPAGGAAVKLSVDDFERVGNCGGGASVVNDGCSVVMKDNPKASHAYGRFDPLGVEWIDSQDINELKWTVNSSTAFTSMAFALTDAHDQKDSHFRLSFNDDGNWSQIWEIGSREKNGGLHWLLVEFDAPVTAAELLFSTKATADYDGFGISAVSLFENPAPVPVPAALPLLVGGIGALAVFRKRRQKRA